MSADNNGTHPTLDPIFWFSALLAADMVDGQFDEGPETCFFCGSTDHTWRDCDEYEEDKEEDE